MRKILAMTFLVCVLAGTALGQTYTVQRLNGGQPILDAADFSAVGASGYANTINGPSVIAVPDWISAADRPDASANYYMYFADHAGDFIRMAWASQVDGPWTIFNTGTSGPGSTNAVGRGVLDMDLGTYPNQIGFGDGQVSITDHIASPDVHVDNTNQQIVMYFHGPSNALEGGYTGSQKTFVATSTTGLNFNKTSHGGEVNHGVQNTLLGNAYYRVFEHGGEVYAISNYGELWKAPDASDPWAPDPADVRSDAWVKTAHNPLQVAIDADPERSGQTPRHSTVRLLDDGQTLEVLFSIRGDAPEEILRTTIDLSSGDWAQWTADANLELILTAEEDWEGANLPIATSLNGTETNVHQLRDPYLFEDTDGALYLFYTGQGEEAIGVASLTPVPEPTTLALLALGGLAMVRRRK